MPQYKGPCNRCDAHVDRRIKPGKEKLCLECALGKMRAQQQGYRAGTDPGMVTSLQAGETAGEQMRMRRGPVWERWEAGMRRYFDSLSTTDGETSDTFPA